MGELDLLKPTIERALGGTIHFGRVSMKPGKPTTFATVPYKPSPPTTTTTTTTTATATQQEREKRLIFSLPGNPASALVTLNLFVLPSLYKSMGLASSDHHHTSTATGGPGLGLPLITATLTHSIPLDPKRTEYHRAVVSASRRDGRLYATSTGIIGVGQRSSRVGSLAKANALLVLHPGKGVIDENQSVEALLMGNLVASN